MNIFFTALSLVQSKEIPHTPADVGSGSNLQAALDVLYEVVGALAVLMLVIAALRYIIAAGDPNTTAEAKRMIVYTLVGVVIVAFAGTIVEFVMKATS